MSTSTSHLEESGVWCADEESGDDSFSSVAKSPSPCAARTQAKHSGGSVDASGDVQLVNVRDAHSSKVYSKSKCASKKLKRSIKTKRGSSNSSKIYSTSASWRSSSFSKIFSSDGKTSPDVVSESTIGIKQMPNRRTFEGDDADVMWPDPGLFNVTTTQDEKKISPESNRSRTKSASTTKTEYTTTSIGVDSTLGRRHDFQGRMAVSERGTITRKTISRSVTSRPSLASCTTREFQLYSENQAATRDASVFYVDEKRSCKYGETAIHEKSDTAKSDPLEQVVESINVRNFMDKNEKPNSNRLRLSWFTKHLLRFLYLATIFTIVLCFLLLGLTAWLIQDRNKLRLDLNKLNTLFHQFNQISRGSSLNSFEVGNRNSSEVSI